MCDGSDVVAIGLDRNRWSVHGRAWYLDRAVANILLAREITAHRVPGGGPAFMPAAACEGEGSVGTIRIRTKVEGDTLVLPELKLFVGKTVDIEVTERSDEVPPASRWAAAAEAVKGLTDYDFGAWEEQRAFDAKHATDHIK